MAHLSKLLPFLCFLHHSVMLCMPFFLPHMYMHPSIHPYIYININLLLCIPQIHSIQPPLYLSLSLSLSLSYTHTKYLENTHTHTAKRMSAWKDGDPRVDRISSAIRVVPDFPKPGLTQKCSLYLQNFPIHVYALC